MSEKIVVRSMTVLAKSWGTLSEAQIDYRRDDGMVQHLTREVYDHGNAAAILLADPHRDTVLLVRQFRYPVHAEGDDGFVLEVCAGLLDGDDPLTCATREAIEETGHAPRAIRPVGITYASPGSVKERTSLFIGEYGADTRRSAGGGLEAEGEEIEIVELPFAEALAMIVDGRIVDAKTVILLQRLALERAGLLGG